MLPAGDELLAFDMELPGLRGGTKAASGASSELLPESDSSSVLESSSLAILCLPPEFNGGRCFGVLSSAAKEPREKDDGGVTAGPGCVTEGRAAKDCECLSG